MALLVLFTGKRITKAYLARKSGLSQGQITPQKTTLVKLAHQQHLEKAKIQRRFKYAAKNIRALAIKLQQRKRQPLNSMSMSYGARFILGGELKNYGRSVNARQWSLPEKCYWLGLYKRSPKAFRWLRQTLTLPSEKTLKLSCLA